VPNAVTETYDLALDLTPRARGAGVLSGIKGAPLARSTLSAVTTRVYVEAGAKKTFASAAGWPGWCRSGKDEAGALAALAAYAPRYARVATLAGIDLPKDATNFQVVERLRGNATTDFGAPGIAAKDESRPLTPAEIRRMASLLDAAWAYLEQVRAKAPESLLKGPRGGGRDREKMYAHVLDSESGYSRQVGVRLKELDRGALREALMHPSDDYKWPAAYAMRRIAWHALDHAWEMEDRIP
jgi:hypothetical protein